MCWGFPRRRPKFLSTPSARRATPKAVKASVTMSISIHALREEGDRRLGAAAQVGEGISIHALREEGDAGPAFPRCRPAISIHALREEGDAAKSMWNAQPAEFLSTPSARRATPPGQVQQIRHVDFYPRPPRGGRRAQGSGRAAERNFYPRPPRGGRLCPAWLRFCGCCYFYPRPPRGGRHQCAMSYITTFNISIHALREEGDWMISLSRAIPSISIHALREEGDRASTARRLSFMQFLSTPSARRATETCEAEGKYH